jgi:hypothetical protein
MNGSTHSPQPLDQQRQRFERLLDQAELRAHRPSTGRQKLLTLGGNIVRFLTSERSLRVWQRTRQGRQAWFAYDPITDQTRQFHTEQDLRIWLDQRYYE